MNKIILITGSNSGLGLATAILFAKKGHTVYASMRDLNKKNDLLARAAAQGVSVHPVPLDVTDTDAIADCISEIIDKEGRIDILINNAGAGFAKSTEQATLEEIQWVTDVNYHSVVYCTKAVIPYMRAQGSGHIINISSVGGLVGQPFNELYCAAKFAVEGYTEAMATYITAAFGIQFSIVEPGGISSEFAKSATEKTMDQGSFIEDAYLPILNNYITGIQKRASEHVQKIYQTPEEVADIVLGISEEENPPLRIRTSEWANELTILKTKADPDGTKLLQQVKETFLS